MLKDLSATNQHRQEVQAGERFEFGANWSRFLRLLDDSRIQQAEESLRSMLNVATLSGMRFLDAGSGSGLFSLAARRLGATVYSFDYDPRSVACTEELKRRYFPGDAQWVVAAGSVLDPAFLSGLGQYDIVYSWGVLHHTGNMRAALQNVVSLVAPAGKLFIALYNDQGWISKYWSFIKRQYNLRPATRPLLILAHAPYLLLGRFVVRALKGKVREARGMSLYYDMVDWLGGWPFEVSRPADIVDLYASRGFTTRRLITVGSRLGCNEFVFDKQSAS